MQETTIILLYCKMQKKLNIADLRYTYKAMPTDHCYDDY